MIKKAESFNSSAKYDVNFLNPDTLLGVLDGEAKPCQAVRRFEEMFKDIAQTASLFVDHLIALHVSVLGEKATLESLKGELITDENSEWLNEQIDAMSLDDMRLYLGEVYARKVHDIKHQYTLAEQILDQWTEQNRGNKRLFDFPAFQDYYIKHPLNTDGTPLASDNGNDDRYALNTNLFRVCLKSPYSALSKLFSDYTKPESYDHPFRKEFLTDLQRARITTPDQKVYEYMKAASHFSAQSVLHQNSHNNMGAIQEDNRLVAPRKMTGHRVFFQKFALPAQNGERGSLVELQILPHSIMTANDITHVLMDKADDLLNVPSPSLESRIQASFLYNLCSYIHKRCAQIGGFQKIVGEGLDTQETTLNMMLQDQRADTKSAVINVQIGIETLLTTIANGEDTHALSQDLLDKAEFACIKATKNWKSSTHNLYRLHDLVDERINLLIGNETKSSSKDYREAALLREVQRLIYEQAADTNIFPDMWPPGSASKDTRELDNIVMSNPELAELVAKLVNITEEETTRVILGHKPNISAIRAHCLGLVNEECNRLAPDKASLSRALNKSSKPENYVISQDKLITSDSERYLLNRKRKVEFYGRKTGCDGEHFLGLQRDIFGNINIAVEYHNGQANIIDMNTLQNRFSHNFVRLNNVNDAIDDSIRKDITRKIAKILAKGTSMPSITPPAQSL